MIDYHLHSERSADANGSIIEICKSCINLGMKEICFTYHLDFDPQDFCYGFYNYKLALQQIMEAKDLFSNQISIKSGVEVDYQKKFHNIIEDFIGDKNFDYVLGSAHYIEGTILEDHKALLENKKEKDIYKKYFEVIYSVVDSGLFNTIAHIDLCKRYGVFYYRKFETDKYSDIFDDIIKLIIHKDVTLEINTSGLRQSPKETYPNIEVIKKFQACGGKNIIVGSDSHCIGDAGKGIKKQYLCFIAEVLDI